MSARQAKHWIIPKKNVMKLILLLKFQRLNRALEEANKLRGELNAAEREKKEAKVL